MSNNHQCDRAPRLAPLAAALCGLLAVPGFALAQNQSSKGTAAKPEPQVNLQPWTVTCSGQPTSKDLTCVMTQQLRVRQNNLRVLTVTLFKDPQQDNLVMRLGLPHGILLAEGVEISVDKGQSKNIPIRSADANGSYANAVVDAELLENMRKGSVLNVALKSLAGERIALQISLSGFEVAFGKL